jgi:hypothetical protein
VFVDDRYDEIGLEKEIIDNSSENSEEEDAVNQKYVEIEGTA